MTDLETYLKESYDNVTIDHIIRASVNDAGEVFFYVHPFGRDGETLDFKVEGNQLIPLR